MGSSVSNFNYIVHLGLGDYCEKGENCMRTKGLEHCSILCLGHLLSVAPAHSGASSWDLVMLSEMSLEKKNSSGGDLTWGIIWEAFEFTQVCLARITKYQGADKRNHLAF